MNILVLPLAVFDAFIWTHNIMLLLAL